MAATVQSTDDQVDLLNVIRENLRRKLIDDCPGISDKKISMRDECERMYQRRQEEKEKEKEELRTDYPNMIRIVLVVKTGAGKSSLGNAILGVRTPDKYVDSGFIEIRGQGSGTVHCKTQAVCINGRTVQERIQRRQEEKEKKEKEEWIKRLSSFKRRKAFDDSYFFRGGKRHTFAGMYRNSHRGSPVTLSRKRQETRERYSQDTTQIGDKPLWYSKSTSSQRQNNVTNSVTRAMTIVAISSTSEQMHRKQYTGRVDVYFGDEELLMPHNRIMLGIHGSVVARASLPIPQNPGEEPQLSVTLQLVGEDKEHWSHTRSASGEIALQQVQRLYLGSLVEKLLTTGRCLPMSALWHLSTTDGLPHDLQARVLISDVNDSPKGRPLLTLAAEVLAK